MAPKRAEKRDNVHGTKEMVGRERRHGGDGLDDGRRCGVADWTDGRQLVDE